MTEALHFQQCLSLDVIISSMEEFCIKTCKKGRTHNDRFEENQMV